MYVVDVVDVDADIVADVVADVVADIDVVVVLVFLCGRRAAPEATR